MIVSPVKDNMMKVKIITDMWCEYCTKAKSLLIQNDIAYEELDLIDGIDLMEKHNLRTIPQIFVDDKLIEGGYEGLVDLLKAKRLSEAWRV